MEFKIPDDRFRAVVLKLLMMNYVVGSTTTKLVAILATNKNLSVDEVSVQLAKASALAQEEVREMTRGDDLESLLSQLFPHDPQP